MDAVPTFRVVDARGRAAVLVQMWDARSMMPTADIEKRRPAEARDMCRADIMDVMRATPGPKTRKDINRLLKEAGRQHGPGTVAKALAELTKSGDLVNPQDKKGYRLGGWRRDQTPSLFD
ncbi:hypothetical protein GobsT_63380 [Gemmata obscuriglobus]|uniref:Uncharacterized protein n=2 Tax=Gemmata obscuriglobus TaxID=114 RepID=A0A2Z3GRI3_9BACT|nr:hypothetical protein C1280_02135 [Gemmata obscuriglobus]QEG31516.1 hypothetical protein GobsT_63380 [Gemmata obscuriglobus]VTS10858.1 unnamed protein product [Gemmata obscuriglobus UQM 2246]